MLYSLGLDFKSDFVLPFQRLAETWHELNIKWRPNDHQYRQSPCGYEKIAFNDPVYLACFALYSNEKLCVKYSNNAMLKRFQRAKTQYCILIIFKRMWMAYFYLLVHNYAIMVILISSRFNYSLFSSVELDNSPRDSICNVTWFINIISSGKLRSVIHDVTLNGTWLDYSTTLSLISVGLVWV